MAITFNTTDGIQGNLGADGLYAHITQIAGPHKIAAITDPVIAEHLTKHRNTCLQFPVF